ncbi:hypothetical protein BDW22DRAFT_1363595 [Trametopsis cervina]|nr:hypothetical protein BDW22DRAFT_1363595 [Trametopsis cervina]
MIAISTIEDTVTVVKFLKEFIDDWKNAPDEIMFLKSQATAVDTLLRNVAAGHPRGINKIPGEGSGIGEYKARYRSKSPKLFSISRLPRRAMFSSWTR